MRRENVGHLQLEFSEFYRSSRDDCLRTVLAIVTDRHLAEDLVAEAFARALAHWRKVSRHPAPAAWVVRTALNTRVSWWRARRREVSLTVNDDRPWAPVPEGVDVQLRAAVRALPRRQREVLALRVFLDLDAQQTAQTLGISASTVSVHLFRALAHLREGLSVDVTRSSHER